MIFFLALFGFIIFSVIYAFLSAAVIYHLRAYTLPGWTLGKTAMIFFLLSGAILFIFAFYFFFQVPWNSIGSSQDAYFNAY